MLWLLLALLLLLICEAQDLQPCRAYGVITAHISQETGPVTVYSNVLQGFVPECKCCYSLLHGSESAVGLRSVAVENLQHLVVQGTSTSSSSKPVLDLSWALNTLVLSEGVVNLGIRFAPWLFGRLYHIIS